jgi:UDP-N-acetylmuramate dehydrogenase
MTTTPFRHAMRDRFGEHRLSRDVPLALLTTFKVGGPAEWLIEVRDGSELRDTLQIAAACRVPVVLLGGGSNVLVADAGVRGLVVRLRGGQIARVAPDRIRADAGVTINGLVRWTLTNSLSGIELWAGTPGTVGGAVHGNAHFQGRLIGDLIAAATLVSLDGRMQQVPGSALEFGYDWSRLQRTREAVLSADFIVGHGNPALLRAVARESLAFRKRTQPLASPSAGCIFQNPDRARDHVPDDVPCSAGALVDRAGLKGAREGHALVSQTHGNFIVNEGGATAEDIRALIERCKLAVHDAFGVLLREEIVYIGFDGREERGHGDTQN